MNFAIIGSDELTEKLAVEIDQSPAHRLVWSARAEAVDNLVALERADAEIVILARQKNEAQLLKTIGELTTFSGTVFLSHPVSFSVLAGYEIERIAENAMARILPLRPAIWHPATRTFFAAVLRAAEAGTNSEVGYLERVEMERSVTDGDWERLLASFARDVGLICPLAGNFAELAAMASGPQRLPLSVQLSGRSGVLARWSAVQAHDHAAAARLTIYGSAGEATLWIHEGEKWRAEIAGETRTFGPLQLVDACAERACGEHPGVRWSEVTDCLEITEALEKSLRRGRLVRLNLEGQGEATAFKGTMASLGCGLLMGGLLLLVISAVVLKLAEVSGFSRLAAIFEKVPLGLAVVLVLFLALQFLRYLIPTSGRSDQKE
jgi:hypothetical protein